MFLPVDSPARLIHFVLNMASLSEGKTSARKTVAILLMPNPRFAQIEPILFAAGKFAAANTLFYPLMLILKPIGDRVGVGG